jgi:NAD(P)-dependent dehydrogenase (short-subunit alcohol dehydrogenase family)
MGEFENQVAVVTGGGSGIGLSVAKQLDAEGAKLALFGRKQNKLDEATASLKRAIGIKGSVTKTRDLERFYREVEKRLGKIDILVANAGIAEQRKLQEVDEEFFDEIVDTDYKGLYFTIQKSLPFLNEGASVILIASVAGHLAWPGHGVYSSAKAAVCYLARSFAGELIERKIRVNAISQGAVDTPIFDSLRATSPEIIDQIAEKIPVKRFAKPEEIAHAVCFLASKKSAYIVGADLVIDGGLSAITPPIF